MHKNDSFALLLKETQCPGGGIGRRAGLKHLWVHPRTGSTPVLGTKKKKAAERLLFYFKNNFLLLTFSAIIAVIIIKMNFNLHHHHHLLFAQAR
jgi:hypothetical protein